MTLERVSWVWLCWVPEYLPGLEETQGAELSALRRPTALP